MAAEKLPTQATGANIRSAIANHADAIDDHETRIDTLEAITPVTAEELAIVSGVADSALSGLGNKVDKITGSSLIPTTKITKLDGIATGATANDTDANLKNRANHTGTQAATTIVEDATHRFVTDTEKSTWNAGTGGGGAVTESQVLTATGATKLKGGNLGDNVPKLPIWFKKLKATPTTLKVFWVGDSTSDFTSNASLIPTLFGAKTFPGDVLAGLNTTTLMPNFGVSGNTLTNFMANSPSGKGIDSVIAGAPDLIIFCYGINNVRQNQLTKDQLKALIITAIDRFRAEIPDVSIILRMPNSFLSVSPNNYILQGTYPSIAAAAQAQTDILYYAYKELENYWDANVQLLDTQEKIYGRISQPTSVMMSDEIHPVYFPMVNAVVDMLGYKEPFSSEKAILALVQNYAAPWTVYNRSLELADNYKLIWEGRYGNQGSNFIDAAGDAYAGQGKIMTGDIINVADSLIFKPTSIAPGTIANSFESLRLFLGSNVPANTITGGSVKVYRSIFNFTKDGEKYFKDVNNYPYRRRVKIGTAGNGFLRINLSLDDNLLTEKTPGTSAARYRLTASDVLVVEGIGALPLTGATFNLQDANTLAISKSGDYTTYQDKIAYIFGNHSYESPTLDLTYGKLGIFDGGTFGGVGAIGLNQTKGGVVVQEPLGNKKITGYFFSTGTVPAGNTIANTTTKTYFASVFNSPANSSVNGQVITFEGAGRLSTGATPGTIQIGLDAVQTVSSSTSNLGNTGNVALPVSVTNMYFKLKIDVFIVLAAGSGTIECQGDITLANGTIIPFTNLTSVSPINMDVSEDYKLFATFSLADAANTITLRTLKVLSS